MALFKIHKGERFPETGQITKATEGFAYFTTEDGKFYIDISGDGTETAVIRGPLTPDGNRVPLNAYKADIADKISKILTINLNTENNGITFDGSANVSIKFYAPPIGGVADIQALVGNGATTAPKWVNIDPSISITDGDANNAPKVNVNVLGQSGTAKSITKATTGVYGVAKLTSTVTLNTSEETLAVTPKGVVDAINRLDVSAVGVAAATGNRYICDISQTNGKISATLATATIGSTYIPIWIDGGTLKQITENSVLTNLASTTAASTYAASPRPGVTGILGTANGGTGNNTYIANRLIYSETANKLSSTSNISTDGNSIHFLKDDENYVLISNKYNDVSYALLRDHHNGNISLSASSGGLYVGYANTQFTSISQRVKIYPLHSFKESTAISEPGWIRIASLQLNDNNHLGQAVFDFTITRSYSSGAPEIYTVRVTAGWQTCTLTQLSGSIKVQRFTEFRVARDDVEHKAYFEIYLNDTPSNNVVYITTIDYTNKTPLEFLSEPEVKADSELVIWKVKLKTAAISSNKSLYISSSSQGLFLTDSNNSLYGAIFNNDSNLWIGATATNENVHTGKLYFHAGKNASGIINRSAFLAVGNNDTATTATNYVIAYGSGGGPSQPVYVDTYGKVQSITGALGNDITGNANTATAFASNATTSLTGDITGSANGTHGWSINTTIGTGKVTNAMLAGSITNNKLVNSTIEIAGTNIALGSSIDRATLLSNLGLTNAAHYIGKATKELTDGGTENPTISGYDFANDRKSGDIVLGKDGDKEYIWGLNGWELLGPVDTIQASTGTGIQNRMAYYSASNMISSSSHYTTDTEVAINKNSITSGYAFEVNGDSIYDGNIRLNNTILERLIESKKADGPGWARNIISILDKEGTSFAHLGAYGSAENFYYLYLGSGAYNSANNLRIYPAADGQSEKIAIGRSTIAAPAATLYVKGTPGEFTFRDRKIAPVATFDGQTYFTGGLNGASYILTNVTNASTAKNVSGDGSYYLYGNNVQYGRLYIANMGLAPTENEGTYSGASAGHARLILGNNIINANSAEGGADNAYGDILLYRNNGSYAIYEPAAIYYQNNLENADVFSYQGSKSTTADEDAYATWVLGNSVKKTSTTAHSEGRLRIYSDSSGYHQIVGTSTTGARVHYFPDASGWIVTGGNGTTTGVGGADQIVYLNTSGVLTAGTSATNADTANTIVKRDASGNFSAGTITATLNGNAATATAANIISTDNAIVRFDGTAGKFQNSTVIIDDNGYINSKQFKTSSSETILNDVGYITIYPYDRNTYGNATPTPAKFIFTEKAYTTGVPAKTLMAWSGIDNIKINNFIGALKGNADTATKWAAAQKVYVTLGTASTTTTIQGGSTSAQTIGVDGTLGTAHGGTGNTSFTANRLIYSESDTKLSSNANLITNTEITYGGRTLTPTLRVNSILYVDSRIESGGYFLVNKASKDASYYLYTNGVQYGRLYVSSVGTVATEDAEGTAGLAMLILGNSTAQPAAGATTEGANNASGTLRLFSPSSGYMSVKASTVVRNHLHYLPVYSTATSTSSSVYYGRLVGIYKSTTSGDDDFSDVGSTSQPVYVTANGVIKAITGALGNDITGNAATATKIYSTTTPLASASTKYYLEFQKDLSTTSGNVDLRHHQNVYLVGTTDAASTATRYVSLVLGNNTATGTATNARGSIQLYGENTVAMIIKPENLTTSIILGAENNMFTMPKLAIYGSKTTDKTNRYIHSDDLKNIYFSIDGTTSLVIRDDLVGPGQSYSNQINLGATNRLWHQVHAKSYYVEDTRNENLTAATNDKAIRFFFSNNDMPDNQYWSGIHVRGWAGGYSSWELVGPADDVDQRTTPLYIKTSNINTDWGEWRPILDSYNGVMRFHYGGTGTTTKILITINNTSSWMASFTLRLYQGYQATDLQISGYNYNNADTPWSSPQAIVLGSTAYDGPLVYFGYTDTQKLWVAVDGARYTGVDVFGITNGYTQINLKDFCTITNVSTLPGTLQKTVRAYSRLTHNVVSDTGDITLHNQPGTFAFSGNGDPWSGNDWVGFQVGNNLDKFQIVRVNSNNLLFRQNDSGGVNTSWGAWEKILTDVNTSWAAWTSGTTAGPQANLSLSGTNIRSAAIPSASASASGVVTTSAQTFAGNKTFVNNVYFANGTTYYINSSGTGNLNALTINSTTASTTTSTGGLIVKGGAGIAGRVTASEFNATRPMIISAGKVYSNISGSNVILPAKTTMLFADGIAIANPGLTAASDVGWLRVTGTAETDMALELATGDDGGSGETIHVRQYNTSNAIVNDLTLLDTNGDTSIPGKLFIKQPDTGRDHGIIGTYNYKKAAAIWSMGSSYQIAADGSGLGTLYGAAYGYQNQDYLESHPYASGHQFLWCANGTINVALGTNLWARNTIMASSDPASVTTIGTNNIGSFIYDNGTMKLNSANGSWAYLRLHNGLKLWDIATHATDDSDDNTRNSMLQFRPGGAKTNALAIDYSGNLIFRGTGTDIKYKGTKATYSLIHFIDNTSDGYGNGIQIGGGGLTMIGGGESATTVFNGLTYTGGSEQMIITNDNEIRFYPEQGSAYTASALIQMTAGKIWAGVNGDTTRENQVGVQSGAGPLYMYSAAATTGTKGIYFSAANGNPAGYVAHVDSAHRVYYNSNFTSQRVKLINKDTTDEGIAAGTWLRTCIVQGYQNYANFQIRLTGGWSTGSPTVATIDVHMRNGEASMKLVHRGFLGVIGKIKLVKIATNTAYVDVYVREVTKNTEYFGQFIGNVTTSQTDDTTHGSVNVTTTNVAGLATLDLTVGVGDGTTPVYINAAGKPVACTAYGSATVNIANKLKTTQATNATKMFILGQSAAGAGQDTYIATAYSSGSANTTGIYFQGSTGVLMGAAWNDYAEFRQLKENKMYATTVEPGRVVYENGDDTLSISSERLMRGCSIVSDTYGFGIGESEKAQLPVAVSGRVLAYPYENREDFKNYIGWPVCSGPNGTVSIMTEEEERDYPSRIIGTISSVPDYEVWHGGADVIVDGRVWIKVR